MTTMINRLTSPFVVAAAVLLVAGGGVRAGGPALDAGVRLAVPGRSNAHPSVAASGSFVAVAWGAATPEGRWDVFLATSRDSGTTFGPPVRVNAVEGEGRLGGEMPPRVVLRSLSRGAYEIVVLWTARGPNATTIKLATSSDSGRTFGAPRELQTAGAAGDRGWPALALDARGTAYAVWLDHRRLASNGARPAGHAHGQARAAGPAVPPSASGLFFAASGAARPVAEREVTSGVCYCCKTALAVSSSGTVYAAWRQVYDGSIRDIAFAASRDGGRTFSAPLRVSEDGWQINGCPDDGPSLAVRGNGTVDVVWPTVVASGGTLEGALFLSTTRNGRTFAPRLRVPTMGSAKPSHPQVIADANGGLLVSWDEIVGGRRTAFVRSVRGLGDSAPTFGPVARLSDDAGGAYPAIASTAGGPIAAWTAGSADAASVMVARVTAR